MGHSLIYDGFDPYDGDEVYKCPCCGKRYYSWDLIRSGIELGDSFECEKCDIKLLFQIEE
jgi:DNA-directed RNA polymerase subunit RPC12/RpoP